MAYIDQNLAIAAIGFITSVGACLSMWRRGVSLTKIIVCAYGVLALVIGLFFYCVLKFTVWPVVG
jgi:hypothetical protein